MNEKVLKTLEFTKIIEKLAGYAGSAMGRAKCEALVPLSDRGEVEELQQETADALSRLFKKGTLSFSGLPDIGASINWVNPWCGGAYEIEFRAYGDIAREKLRDGRQR
jgi:DNA mismatch repair protein MutS2